MSELSWLSLIDEHLIAYVFENVLKRCLLTLNCPYDSLYFSNAEIWISFSILSGLNLADPSEISLIQSKFQRYTLLELTPIFFVEINLSCQFIPDLYPGDLTI